MNITFYIYVVGMLFHQQGLGNGLELKAKIDEATYKATLFDSAKTSCSQPGYWSGLKTNMP